ncbi:MAG: deoxynucleoside kinase [Candidatus Cyclobacteriaceae bacterium M2_1C_046]
MHLAICGNIGSGKTTLAKMLAKHYKWQAELESVEDNPYLADFYNDMKHWAFHLQIYFLNSRFNQVKRIKESKISTVQDRTIYEDAYIFASNLHKSGFMNDRDYASYLTLFESMIQHVSPPDLLIYLKADIPKLVSQIEKRGRDYENAMRLDYLKNLNKHYEDFISSYDHGKLMIINVNNLDFVERVEDFSYIVNKIDAECHGLFS